TRVSKTDRRTGRQNEPKGTDRQSASPPDRLTAYRDAFPNSRKVYLEGPAGIRVPMREIALSGGEPPLRVYDTSGPEGHDVREGLPGVRSAWIAEREVEETERRNDGKTEDDGRREPSVLPSFRPS